MSPSELVNKKKRTEGFAVEQKLFVHTGFSVQKKKVPFNGKKKKKLQRKGP